MLHYNKKFWLIKTEPEEWSWQQQIDSGKKGAEWSGVRNFQAAKNLKEMKLGDKQYGKKNIKFKKINKEFEKNLKKLNRQALHAKSLGFIHPKTNKFVNFESEIPADLKKILDLLNKLSN